MRDLRNSVVSLLLVATLVSFSLGCSRASNQAIAKDVKGKISANPDTKDSKVSVEAKDGKVTLSGSVKSQEARQKIEQIAREESGAKSVDDQTKIVPDATQAGEAVDSVSVAQPSPQPIVTPAGLVAGSYMEMREWGWPARSTFYAKTCRLKSLRGIPRRLTANELIKSEYRHYI